MIPVGIYLAAIVAANLLAAEYGPAITPYTAFLLIGVDLTLRDYLHDRWPLRYPTGWRWMMAGLIVTGGLLSWLVQPDAGRIALASSVAFMVSALLDTLVYHALGSRPWMVRANGSNVVGAAADSILFPTLAFGVFLPLIILGQFAAKVGGGLLWSAIIARRRAPAHSEVG